MPGPEWDGPAVRVESSDDHHDDGNEIGDVDAAGGKSEDGAQSGF